jgi:adenylate cyclase
MRSLRGLLRSPLAASLVASALVFLSILALRRAGSLESLELAAYDWYSRLRPDVSASDSRIVLIAITERDIHNQGRWPLADATLAQVLEMLTQYRPRAIGLDIYRDIVVPPGREELNAILSGNRHIIAVTKLGEGGADGIPPPPVLQHTDQVGFSDIVVDPGGIVRRGLLFLDDAERVAYSLPLRLALLYLRAEGIKPQPDPANPQHIRLGPTTIRPLEMNDGGYVGVDARGYQFLLDFKGVRKAFPSFSLTTLLAGEIDPQAIKDKIVLIGVTAESVKDFFYTPFSRGLQTDQQMSGIELHGHIVSQLLRFGLDGNSPVATTSDRREEAWILLWSIMGGAIGLWVRSPWRFVLSAASGLVVLAFTDYVAFVSGWWIPLVPSAMAWVISAAVVTAYMSNQEKRQRALLMQLFTKYVPNKEVAEIIWQQRDQLLDGGRLRSQNLIATVLFTDLMGFTAMSESRDPQAVMDWLNAYMEAMAQHVINHGGVIDKYIGDSIMAIFGVPLPRQTDAEISQDAANAVNCALEMERSLRQLNSDWQEQQLPTIGMRIGIFTGPLVAGSLGSAQRLEYTVIGDTVNTASRLEGFEKDLVALDGLNSPCRIIIGEATLQRLGHQFATQHLGEVSLKGKDQKITVYGVSGRADRSAGDVIQEDRG